MRHPTRIVLIGAVILGLALLNRCPAPTSHPARLSAIKASAVSLMSLYPANVPEDVPQARWPVEIGALEPQSVYIDASGVHITTAPYFDGGWGYFVPRHEHQLPEPRQRFRHVGRGVYWWHPY